ncbi:alpha/beta hydrolase family protein [Paenibacillus agri]|uniref:Dienelactone hydrolase family protein n=1 Tax=Paenibacillus agri TaxID=2744309 RepID=A0A850EIC6_9BACL|nr:alpha/beta hydrolase [Paenibacillus agri]NUU61103.1 dienelactone hydrolase family protein [Paenibacillus agri]
MEYYGHWRNRAFFLILVIIILITATLSSCEATDPPDSDIEIISKELIEVPGQNPNIDIYKVFYKSDNIKVLAYLTVPKAAGKYPLVVHLHGGYALERKELSHYDFGFTFGFSYMSDEVVYLYPIYRGYLESDGHVQGIAENTRDAENGIKVAMSTGSVKSDSVYLLGASMGGGVALRLASERQDVKAVVGVSPFVGWDVNLRWLYEHPDANSPEIVEENRKTGEYVRFGLINANPESKGDYSILDRIPDIKAPVLLLQGTADESLIWQTVQDFAGDLEKAGKTVKLVLYPDGRHGLADKYQDQRNQEVTQWLHTYGMPKSFALQ